MRVTKKNPWKRKSNHILGEGRMVLPGVEALFGFQLIAVFDQRFADLLPVAG
jgi:hypothetical protein